MSSNTSSLTEISKSKLLDFLNHSNFDNSKCQSKCNTPYSSSSSSSTCKKKKNRKHKSKKHSSTFTTSTTTSCSSTSSSSSCPSSSSSSCSNSCSSSSCSNSCSSSNSSCKNKCTAYALKCKTYKNTCGTVLIPGPPGPSSGSLANFSATSTDVIMITDSEITYENTTSSVGISELDGVLTFGLSGNYLFQYNLYVSYTVPLSEPFPSVSLVLNSSTNFGSQNLPTTGSYGCSIIKDVVAGNTVSLNITGSANCSFASLTVIKL